MSEHGGVPGGALWDGTDDQGVQDRYRALADAIDDAVYEIDADGRVAAVNDIVVERTGYDRRDLVGEHVSTFLDHSDAERVERAVDALHETDEDLFEFELPMEAASGETLSCKLRLSPLEVDGEPRGAVGVARDFTERRAHERELNWYERIVENLPVGVYRNTPGPEGHFVEGNSTLAEIFDADSLAELQDYSVSDLYPDPEQRAEFSRKLAEEGIVRDHELEQVTLDGRRIWISVTAIRTEENGDVYFDGIVQDVTDRKEREHELERYEVLFTESTDVNAVLNPDGTFDYLPPSVENVLGYDPADLEGEDAFERIHPDDREYIVAEFQRMVEDPDYRPTNEFRYRHADGSWVWLESRGRNLLESDSIEGLVAYTRDVTERRRRERELQERERQLSRLMENVPGMVYRCRNERGRPMEFVSDACRDLTGYDPDALERGDVSYGDDVVVEADRDDLWAEVQEGLEDDGTFLVTYRIETAHGDVRWVRERGRGIYDDDGDLERIEGVVIDVTERKRLESELDDVFGRVTDAFYALDDQWRFTHVNDRAEDLLQHAESELLGESLWGVFPEAAEREDVWESFHEAMETQEPRSFETYFGPLDFWVEATVYPSETGVSVYFRDVTEQKRAQRQLEEERDMFAQGPAVAFRWKADAEAGWPMEFVSENVEDLLGYTSAELESGEVSYAELLLEEEIDRIAREAEENSDDTTEWFSHDPYRIKTRDGDVRWVKDTTKVLRDETGEITHYQGYLVDITERRKRERELEESEQRLRTLVENFPNGAVGLVDEDMRYRTVGGNPVDAEAETGDDLAGKTVRQALTPELADLLEPRYRAALEGESSSFEAEHSGRYSRFHIFPVRDEEGEVFAAMGMSQDVTDQKQRERALERSERRYRALAEYFPNGIVTLFDPTLEYTLAAGRGFEDVPVDPAGVEGESVQDVWNESTAEALVPAFEATLDGEERTVELEYSGRDWVVHTVPITDERGDVFAGMTMAQDITEQKERERYLEDAKSQLEAATEAGAVGTWEWHVPEDRFVAGTSLAKQFGVDPEAAREGISLDRLLSSVHEADRDQVEAEIEAALADCGEYEAEYRVWNADGDLRWVVARGHVECDEDGDPVRFPGAITDITERKRAEMELQRSRDELQTLFEVLPVGVVVADADGQTVEANDTAREIWGGDVFDADSVEEYAEYPVRWADSGEEVDPGEMTLARVLDGEEVTEPDVYEIEAADGERRIIRVDGKPVRDEFGRVTRGVATLTDITERREYRRQLEESERRYRTLAENFPNGGVGVYDEDLRYSLVTGTMWDDIDPDPSDLEGNTIWEALPPDTAEDVEPIFRGALDGETGSVVSQLGGRTYRVWATPVCDAAGEITGGQSFAVDISEQIEREEQLEELVGKLEESNERLEQFAYAASHDLQEPLRMVSSYLSLIDRRYGDDLDEDGREFLEFAVDGAERMREMIDALLEYSRVETRGDPFEPVDLDEVFADVRRDFGMRIEESGAEIEVESLPTVEGDEDQLRQVFGNLLSNAIEYSGDEPPRIEIRADREGSEWVVAVSDEGIGIDPDHIDRIFQVFQRLHTQDEHAGTGIGLALCQRIVERHGGRIWAESEPGEGTTFYFTLPAAGGDKR